MVYPEKVVPLHVLITKGMPRQTRKKSGTGIYHVMLRGINRQDIFQEEEDYLHFLWHYSTSKRIINQRTVPWFTEIVNNH